MKKQIIISCAVKTELGHVRQVNEDNYLLASWEDRGGLLAVLADGMGGERGGEVASQIVIDTFGELLEQPLPFSSWQRYKLLRERFYAADTAIRERACQDFQLMNMGATALATIVTPTDYIHLYAGDCRLYHFRQGIPLYVSADHSVVRLLLELGQIEPQEVATHPMRSLVNSCLGGQGNTQLTVSPQWQNEGLAVLRQWQPGDVLLLCSDGLYREIDEGQLQSLVQQFGDFPDALTEACVKAALEKGGKDNITAIALRHPDF
jgi:protein phosphatase